MIYCTCIQRYKQKGVIVQYKLQANNRSKDERVFSAEQVKNLIRSNQIVVSNLTLTSDGRLVTSCGRKMHYKEPRNPEIFIGNLKRVNKPAADYIARAYIYNKDKLNNYSLSKKVEDFANSSKSMWIDTLFLDSDNANSGYFQLAIIESDKGTSIVADKLDTLKLIIENKINNAKYNDGYFYHTDINTVKFGIGRLLNTKGIYTCRSVQINITPSDYTVMCECLNHRPIYESIEYYRNENRKVTLGLNDLRKWVNYQNEKCVYPIFLEISDIVVIDKNNKEYTVGAEKVQKMVNDGYFIYGIEGKSVEFSNTLGRALRNITNGEYGRCLSTKFLVEDSILAKTNVLIKILGLPLGTDDLIEYSPNSSAVLDYYTDGQFSKALMKDKIINEYDSTCTEAENMQNHSVAISKMNGIYEINGKRLVKANIDNLQEYIIPEGIEVIEPGAFDIRIKNRKGCNIVIPNSLKVIKRGAFNSDARIDIEVDKAKFVMEPYCFSDSSLDIETATKMLEHSLVAGTNFGFHGIVGFYNAINQIVVKNNELLALQKELMTASCYTRDFEIIFDTPNLRYIGEDLFGLTLDTNISKIVFRVYSDNCYIDPKAIKVYRAGGKRTNLVRELTVIYENVGIETTISQIIKGQTVHKFDKYSNKEKPIYEIRDILRNNYCVNMIDFNTYDVL